MRLGVCKHSGSDTNGVIPCFLIPLRSICTCKLVSGNFESGRFYVSYYLVEARDLTLVVLILFRILVRICWADMTVQAFNLERSFISDVLQLGKHFFRQQAQTSEARITLHPNLKGNILSERIREGFCISGLYKGRHQIIFYEQIRGLREIMSKKLYRLVYSMLSHFNCLIHIAGCKSVYIQLIYGLNNRKHTMTVAVTLRRDYYLNLVTQCFFVFVNIIKNRINIYFRPGRSGQIFIINR